MWFVAISVCLGWILSVCLHEFGHAIVAYLGGDTSVKNKGYLTLNPLRYTHPQMSLLLPIIFLLIGGIALPGGAVYFNQNRLKNRWWKSAVSAAGPLATAIFAILLAIPFWFGLVSLNREDWIGPSLAFLILLEIAAFVLNLLPIPSLDGYGIIEPWLPQKLQSQFNKFGQYGIWFIFGLLWFSPDANHVFWNWTYSLYKMLNVPLEMAEIGYSLFRQQSLFLVLGLIGVLFLFRRQENGWYERGNKHLNAKEYEKAIAAYDQTIKIKPDYDEAWYNRGVALYNLKRYQEAVSSTNEVIEIQPDNIGAWYNRGVCLYNLQQYQEAIASFERVLEMDAKNADAWYNQACCYALQGNVSLAIESIQQAIKLNPEKFREQAKIDADFDAIRNDKYFINLNE